jgi:hypothetical protein
MSCERNISFPTSAISPASRAAWQDHYGRQPHPFACVQVPGPLPASGAAAIGDFWIYAG